MASGYSDPYETWKAQGRPGGSFQAWQAGQSATAAPAAATAPGPGAFSPVWMQQGLDAYAAGQRGSDPLNTPGFDPATFRQQYAAAAGGNRPEDLARFLDPTLAGWMPFYDPQQGKYRSMRGAEGWFDKPTECPPGMVPSGPSETDPCISPGGGAQAPQAAPVAAQQTQAGGFDLASLLSGLQGTAQTGGFTGGGVSKPQNLAQTITPIQSSLQGLLKPQQGLQTGVSQASQGLGTGWLGGGGGPLQDMMTKRQRQPLGGQRWF